ncbi:thymosin beta-4-like [Sturnira hondurensis]|uniref:thymosin beta-4-like n=1 Tax=Sturnira hondurensis TaxID=192404 RepID=UPI00187939BA|nr:thymosin beta-4-like [Sturnira hondurensis]
MQERKLLWESVSDWTLLIGAPHSTFSSTTCDKPTVAKIEKSDKSELKKTEMQEKNLLLAKEMTEPVKGAGES